MHRIVPFVMLALAAPLLAQSAEAPARDLTVRRQGFSVNLGLTTGEAKGTISEGAERGSGAGLAYEQPLGPRSSWRAELGIGSLVTDVGTTDSGMIPYPSTLNLMRTSIGGGVRRYATNGLFAGAGAALHFTYDCWVDQEGGAGFFGGQSIECEDMTTPPFESVSVTPSAALSAGWQTGRWELELRYDQGFGAAARSEDRTGTARSIGAFLHYRFGKRAP